MGEYMAKVDGATMFYALEARAPFLDADLCEFARSLPYDLRLRAGQLKAVLRELARREIGGRVAEGRKRGFGIPAERWMLDRWRSNVDEAFGHSKLADEGWIGAAGLARGSITSAGIFAERSKAITGFSRFGRGSAPNR